MIFLIKTFSVRIYALSGLNSFSIIENLLHLAANSNTTAMLCFLI